MKNSLLAFLLLASVYVSAQSFDGVSISGDLSTAVTKYKSKGYTLSKYFENGAILKGNVAGNSIELYIFTTPKSKKVCKMVAFLEEDISWRSLKSNYTKFYDIFLQKYGEPDSKYDFFSKPYFDGDGYELQAVRLEKATFAAYWFKRDNLTTCVEISKYNQVKLIYENNLMMGIKDREQSEIESNSF
jgi:hypothetical protein